MSPVTTPKPVTEMIVVRLLPIESAKCPKMMDPTGRPRSVAAKIVPDTIAVVVASRSDGTKYN
jgi:hypothetical protein